MTDTQRLATFAMQYWYLLPVLALVGTTIVIEWLRDV